MLPQIAFENLSPGDIFTHDETDYYLVITRAEGVVFSLRYSMKSGTFEGRIPNGTSPYFVTYQDSDIYVWQW